MSLLLLLVCAPPVAAQQWTADMYAGGTRYDALASFAAATHLVGNVRYESSRFFGYVSGAAPLDDNAALWTAIGAGVTPRRALSGLLRAGMDAGVDAYAFRHEATANGTGLTTHVIPLISLARDYTEFELRAGRRDHHVDAPDGASSRHMYEAGARATFVTTTHVGVADARVLTDGDRTYPMVQVQLGTTIRGVRLWGFTGRWFGDLSQGVGGVGAAIDVGPRGELWASLRTDTDPLYRTPTRSSWNIGYSMKFGRAESAIPVPVLRDGSIIVRLPRDAAAATPSVAGEFSDWEPLPMRMAGDEWLIEIPAGPGVYRFAFVAATGEWFVPEGYPGRMDDDMGGHVAVIVVQ